MTYVYAAFSFCSQLGDVRASYDDAVARQQEQLESMSAEFEGTVAELESTRTANLLARQQVGVAWFALCFFSS